MSTQGGFHEEASFCAGYEGTYRGGRVAFLAGAIVALVPLLTACGGSPPKDPSAKAASDRSAAQELASDLAKLKQSSIASMCSESVLRSSKQQKVEVWGKEYSAPGLPAEQVEAFLCRQRPALEKSCWGQKYSDWERSEIEYGSSSTRAAPCSVDVATFSTAP